MKDVINHIEKYYGKIDRYLKWPHVVGPDVKIAVIEPTDTLDFYTLVTVGLCNYKMDVPTEFNMLKLEYAEVLISLPPYWQLENKDEKWQWPITLMKNIVNLATRPGGWISWGQTFDNLVPFCKTGIEQSAAILVEPQMIDEEGLEFVLDGRDINFYQIIPIYVEELEYKEKYGADSLIMQMENVSFVVNPIRYSSIGEQAGKYIMDDAVWHYASIERKGLDVSRSAVFNHMAIYLRWAMKNNLLDSGTWKKYEDYIRAYPETSKTDLRKFIYEKLKGILSFTLFNLEGASFAKAYYGDGHLPYYPADIDAHALKFFGEEVYNCDEFQDEAYLFVPFNEEYYEDMEKVLDDRFEKWKDGIPLIK